MACDHQAVETEQPFVQGICARGLESTGKKCQFFALKKKKLFNPNLSQGVLKYNVHKDPNLTKTQF